MNLKLRNVIKTAKKSNFYKEKLKDISSLWESVPFTSKEELRSAYPFGLRAVDKSQIESFHESSGTEGKPISSYFTSNDWKDIAERFSRNAVNLNSKDTIFIKTPYSMVTTAHQAHQAALLKSALVIPADNRSSNMPYSRVVQILKDLEVTVTWSLPTETLLWASTAKRFGMDPKTDFPSLRAFWVAGETLSKSKKLAIERIWGKVKVYQDYGSTETGSLAGECSEGVLHLWSDRVYFEVLTKANEVTTEGRGELIVTPLYREAMPLVRYKMGDEVIVSKKKCACGSKHPTISVLGRLSSQVTIQNRTLYPLEIENSVYKATEPHDISYYRVYHDLNEFEVEFSSSNKLDAESALKREFLQTFGIKIKATCIPEEGFASAQMLKQKLKFSKPKVLFQKGDYVGRGLNYY